MHFFTKAILKFGPFKKGAIVWLKNSVMLTMLIFFLKTHCIFLLMYSFNQDYPNSRFVEDSQNLFGYGWLYFGIFLSFIMNIFNYGRKLQEENDLTV